MRGIDIRKLIDWLGRDGAIAGLEKSNITVAEFRDIAGYCGLEMDKKTRRSDIIVDLVNGDAVRINKTLEELLAMKCDDLKNYFLARKVSRTELLNLLMKLDIRPTYGDKGNLVEFTAREISDFGMYQRVASGSRR